MKEIRYLLDVENFNKIPSKYKIDYREDWYFDNYRIRHSYSEPKRPLNGWFKIYDDQASNSNKKKIKISIPNKKLIQEMNKKALFYIKVYSKEWNQNNQNFYIEKVELYKNEKLIKEFYTTEAESKEDLKMIEELKKLPFIKKVEKIGEKSLKQICLDFLKKRS